MSSHAVKKTILFALLLLLRHGATLCSAHSITDCVAPPEYGQENATKCDVTYTHTLELKCPNTSVTSAEWRKQRNESVSDVVCDDTSPVCQLNPDRKLTFFDSGFYFCRVFVSPSLYHNHYVQVTALAPPILENVFGNKQCPCDEPDVYFTSPVVTHPHSEKGVNVTVNYKAVGPVSVEWYHNSTENGSLIPFTCQSPHCIPGPHTDGSEWFTIPGPDSVLEPGDPGTYYCNVSNPYGWNISATEVIITCNSPSPFPLTKNHNQTLYMGSSATLKCQIAIDPQTYLTVCFGKDNSTTVTQNATQNCVSCLPSLAGSCGNITVRPNWNVSREHTHTGNGYCDASEEVLINITNISKDDEGYALCFWGDDMEPYRLYTTVRLNVENKPQNRHKELSLPVIIVISSVGVLVVAATIIAVVGLVLWAAKKRKPGRSQETREYEGLLHNSVTSARTRRARPSFRGRASADFETESEPEYKPRRKRRTSTSGRKRYGSIPEHEEEQRGTDHPPSVESDILSGYQSAHPI